MRTKKTWGRKIRIWFGFFVILVLFFYWSHGWLLTQLGLALVKEDPYTLNTLRLAVVLGGDQGSRVEKAAELYHHHRMKILMSAGSLLWGRPYTSYMRDYGIRLGISPKDILVETQSLSTYENALYSLPIIKALHVKEVAVITSKYHTARSYRIFQKALAGTGIRIVMIGAPDALNYHAWWHTHEMSEPIMVEWGKTVLYWLKWGF